MTTTLPKRDEQGQPVEARTSTIYRTWVSRIDSGVFTKGQCQQWAHVVIPLSESEEPRGGSRTKLDDYEACDLLKRLVARGGVHLTDEHTHKGLEWLERYAAKRLPDLPANWRERFSHFLYVGDGRSYGMSRWKNYVPVWRIVLTDGEAWDYYALSWQAPERGDEAWQVTT